MRFSTFNFNFYQMFVPDILHEFELGVWKMDFTHILRVLHSLPGSKLAELNARYVILISPTPAITENVHTGFAWCLPSGATRSAASAKMSQA